MAASSASGPPRSASPPRRCANHCWALPDACSSSTPTSAAVARRSNLSPALSTPVAPVYSFLDAAEFFHLARCCRRPDRLSSAVEQHHPEDARCLRLPRPLTAICYSASWHFSRRVSEIAAREAVNAALTFPPHQGKIATEEEEQT